MNFLKWYSTLVLTMLFLSNIFGNWDGSPSCVGSVIVWCLVWSPVLLYLWKITVSHRFPL